MHGGLVVCGFEVDAARGRCRGEVGRFYTQMNVGDEGGTDVGETNRSERSESSGDRCWCAGGGVGRCMPEGYGACRRGSWRKHASRRMAKYA